MKTPRLIRCADVPDQPWRNGGGTTRELLALPPGAGWQLRLSVADIQADGPFSAFEGVQRWFVVLQGGGVALQVAGQPHCLTPTSAPLCFPGDASTQCRLLNGPTRDLNLMLRGCAGGLVGVVPGRTWRGPGTACGLFTAEAGRCTVQGRLVALPPMSLLWFDTPPGPMAFASDAACTRTWWVWARLDLGAHSGSEGAAA